MSSASLERVARRVALRHLVAWVPEEFKGQRFQNPETGNKVLFQSLPKEEQDRLRAQLQRDKGQDVQVPDRADPSIADKLKRRMAPSKQSIRQLKSRTSEALMRGEAAISQGREKFKRDQDNFVPPSKMQGNLDKLVGRVSELEKIRDDPSFRKLDKEVRENVESQIKDGHDVIQDMLLYRPGQGQGPGQRKLPTSYKKPSKKEYGKWKRFPDVMKAYKELSGEDVERELFGKKLPRTDKGRPDWDKIHDRKTGLKPDPKMSAQNYASLREQLEEVLGEANKILDSGVNRARAKVSLSSKEKDDLGKQDRQLRLLKELLEDMEEQARKRGPREMTEGEARWQRKQDKEKEKEERAKQELADKKYREELAGMTESEFEKYLDQGFRTDSKKRFLKSIREQGIKENPGISEKWDRKSKRRRAAVRAAMVRLGKDPGPPDLRFLEWAGKQEFKDPESGKKTNFMGLSEKGRADAQKQYQKSQGGSGGSEFEAWVEKQTFKHPQTNNDVKFKSLPTEEQARIRQRWQQKAQGDQKAQKPSSQEGWVSPKKQLAEERFTEWLGQADEKTIEKWQKGSDKERGQVKKQWKHESRRPKTTQQNLEAEKRRVRFEKWIGKQPEKVQEAYQSGDREKQVEVLQKFTKQERAEQKAKEKYNDLKRREVEKKRFVDVDKLMSMPKEQRPDRWVDDGFGNRVYGPTAEVGKSVKLEKATVGGTVEGNSEVVKSTVEPRARVSGNVKLKGSKVESGAVVEDNAKITKSEIGERARVRGDSEINNAKILGGTWDGQKIKDGRGGTFRDSYDQKTLDILTKTRSPWPGPGDNPMRAMVRYFEDGGKTKGWLGRDLDRKKLQKKIQRHIYDRYDRETPALGRGASFLDSYEDEDFDHLLEVAQRKAQERGSQKRKKKAMLYQLTKTALEHPELRPDLMPLVRLGRDSRVASGEIDLRARVIRAAYETKDNALREALVRCVKASDKVAEARLLESPEETDGRPVVGLEEYKALVRVAYTTRDDGRRRELLGILKQAKYSPGFMKWVEKRKFEHQETGNMVKFVSLPPSQQTEINKQWKQNKKDWAKQFKPDGLNDDTELTPEKFDALEVGDKLWISWSPAKEHKVTGFDKTKTGKPVLVMVQVDPETGKEGERRYLHRSSAGDKAHDIHVMPKGAKIKKPEKKKPSDKKPSGIPPEARESLDAMNANAASWMDATGMPGAGAKFSDKDAPFSAGTVIQIEEGGYAPKKYTVKADKLVEGPNGTAMMAVGDGGMTTLIPIGNKWEPKNMKSVEKAPESAAPPATPEPPKTPEAPAATPAPAPAPKPTGKHKDRKALYRVKPKPDGTKVEVSESQKKAFLPDGLSEAAREATEKGMGSMNVGTLKKLKANVGAALADPEGPYMQALSGAGYTPGELSKMNSTIKSMLKPYGGVEYPKTVLDIWNKHDYEEEDADEFYDWRKKKPDTGRKLSWEELKAKFLREAKPETRERMKDMPIDDFKAAYLSILDDEEEEV